MIVTPESYYNWLPKEGGKLKISLEVKSKNVGQGSSRVVSFDLALLSTSISGSTSSAATGPPDLRFLSQLNAALSNQDQLMSFPCTDGRTGELFLGSYNSSASTTLVAFVILADGRWVKGNLLKSGGITEIPIPKATSNVNH